MKSSTSKHDISPSHKSMDQCSLCSHSQCLDLPPKRPRNSRNHRPHWSLRISGLWFQGSSQVKDFFTPAHAFFRREFHTLVQLARLAAFRWHPYSLRRGGATAHYMEFGNLNRSVTRGRWASIKTTRLQKKIGCSSSRRNYRLSLPATKH